MKMMLVMMGIMIMIDGGNKDNGGDGDADCADRDNVLKEHYFL